MSNLAIFNFQEKQVRTAIHENGEIYFCLPDVAEILDIQNSRDIVAKQLNKAGVEKIYISHESGKKLVTFINEPNLYRIIFRSNKKQAIEFQNWVFEIVLPTIRKTGSYSLTIDQASKAHLSEIVRMRTGGNRGQIVHLWQQHNAHFNIASYHDLPESKVKEAESFLWGVPLLNKKQPNPSLFQNLSEGRYLVIVADDEVRIRNIDNCSVVDTRITDLLRKDIRKTGKALIELSQRLNILNGDESSKLLETPLDIGFFENVPT